MTLAPLQSNQLAHYSRSKADRAFADADETLLGHLVLEQGYSLQAAIENLRPHVKQAKTITELSESWNCKLGFGAIGAAVLLATSIPTAGVALAVAPLLAGCISLKFWNDSRSEKPKREAEYKLLRDVVPQLPEFLWGLHLKGCSVIEIVGAYDGLISALEGAIESGKPISENDVSAYLWARIEDSRKMNATLGREVQGEALPSWIDASSNQPPGHQAIAQTQSQSAFQNPEAQDAAHRQAETVAPTALQPPLPIPQDIRSQLIAKLKEDCPLLLKLVKSHPIRAVGVQRSGKTTLVKRLCLLRMVLLPGHQTIAATPHYEPENPYPSAFTVAGIDSRGQRDYRGIEKQWDGMASRVESCETSNLTYVWDEFGLMDKVMPVVKGEESKIKTVMTSCLRETKKFGIYPIFIVHGETAAFLPGVTGLVSPFLESTVRVETIGEMVEGDDLLDEIQPTGKFTVTWIGGAKEEGQLPAWLTEDYLLSLIGQRSASPVAVETEVVQPSFSSVQAESEMHWKESFVRNMPPGLNESEFMDRYELEKNLQEATAIEVSAVVDPRPDGLDEFPLVSTIWDYLDGKEPRSLKQISGALKTGGRISEDDLRSKLGDFETYKDAIKTVIGFGVSKGYLKQVSEDSYTAIKK